MRFVVLFLFSFAVFSSSAYAQDEKNEAGTFDKFAPKKGVIKKSDRPLAPAEVAALNRFYCKRVLSKKSAVISKSRSGGFDYWYSGKTEGWKDDTRITSDEKIVVSGSHSFKDESGEPVTLKRVRIAVKTEVMDHETSIDASSGSREMTTAIKEYGEAVAKPKGDVRLANKQVALGTAKIVGFYGTDENKAMLGDETDFALFERKLVTVAVRIKDLYPTTKRRALEAQERFFAIQEKTGVSFFASGGLPKFDPKKTKFGEIEILVSTRHRPRRR